MPVERDVIMMFKKSHRQRQSAALFDSPPTTGILTANRHCDHILHPSIVYGELEIDVFGVGILGVIFLSIYLSCRFFRLATEALNGRLWSLIQGTLALG